MTGLVRGINLLVALALLLSGLLQPLAATQGMVCARTHAPKEEAQQPAGSAVKGGTSAPDTARQLLHVGDLPPASLLIHSLFRPPRLS